MIDIHTKLNKGDFILFKPLNNYAFLNWASITIGIVGHYDNIHSLSGLCETYFKYFKISGIVHEKENLVFCGYKNKFLLIGGKLKPTKEHTVDDIVEIYKMNKDEIRDFRDEIIKIKILDRLTK